MLYNHSNYTVSGALRYGKNPHARIIMDVGCFCHKAAEMEFVIEDYFLMGWGRQGIDRQALTRKLEGGRNE